MPLPEGLKNGFTKTRPLKSGHLQGVKDRWNNRDKEDKNAYSVTIEEIEKANYNLDIKNPNNGSEEKEYSLNELLTIMRDKSENINRLIGELSEVLKGVEE